MVAGNTNTVATKAYCHRQYWLMKHSQLYWTLQNTWTYPTAQAYVERLVREVGVARADELRARTARGEAPFAGRPERVAGAGRARSVTEAVAHAGVVGRGRAPVALEAPALEASNKKAFP